MRILYGIQGTGNGHLSRSTKVIWNLKKIGIDVDILVSGNQHQIELPYKIDFNLKGFSFKHHDDGGIDRFGTFLNSNLLTFLKDIKLNVKNYDAIISDFDPISAWAAKMQGVKSYGISNQYSFLSKKLPRIKQKSWIDELIIKNFAPVDVPFGLSYQRFDDFIYHPIIREDIIKNTVTNFDHYVVYLPNLKITDILKELIKHSKYKFIVFCNDVQKTHKFKNCKIKPINKDLFLDSFLSCQGVICSAGFQTTSESIYCKKKLLVIPIKGQYEQLCNTEILKKIGIEIGDLNSIGGFLLSNKSTIKVNWEDPTKQIVNYVSSNTKSSLNRF